MKNKILNFSAEITTKLNEICKQGNPLTKQIDSAKEFQSKFLSSVKQLSNSEETKVLLQSLQKSFFNHSM